MPYGTKTCPGAGRTCPEIISTQRSYCDEHARYYELRRGTPKQRGYDKAHEKLRAEWQAKIDSGSTVRCWRCGTRLAERAWHLGHDHDRTRYRGPECIPCNTSSGGREGNIRRR